jgi:peptidoglycan hydrolase-like protein with peptidoglycan-binding domain
MKKIIITSFLGLAFIVNIASVHALVAYPPAPPTVGHVVLTRPATTVSTNSAALHGSFYPDLSINYNANGGQQFFFQFGTTTSFGNQITAVPIMISTPFPDGHSEYTASVAGLIPGTTYYYRLVRASYTLGLEATTTTYQYGNTTIFTTLSSSLGTFFTAALYFGSHHPEVTRLQLCLRAVTASYGADTPITGGFYSITDKALREFQSTHGIQAIGIVGPLTRAALNQVCSPILNGSASAAVQ